LFSYATNARFDNTSIFALVSLIVFIVSNSSNISSLTFVNNSYSKLARFPCASNNPASNSFNSGVIKRLAFTSVCLCTKSSGIFDICDFGNSKKYPEAQVNLIFKVVIPVFSIKSA
jgi:hypothetical protein